jgi:hypothetical protein
VRVSTLIGRKCGLTPVCGFCVAGPQSWPVRQPLKMSWPTIAVLMFSALTKKSRNCLRSNGRSEIAFGNSRPTVPSGGRSGRRSWKITDTVTGSADRFEM